MQYRFLGVTDIQASVIGLGTYPLGGWMWGGTDESAAIRTIQAALDYGINLIDTAPMYGYGLAEEIVGKAIRDRRSQAVVATKCGIVWDTKDWASGKGELHFYADKNGLTQHTNHYRFYRYLKPESIIGEVEASLKRLQTDYIDLLQTHAQEHTTPIEETMAALEKLRDQGKIRAVGSSNVTKTQLENYCNSGTLDSTQEPYSFINRSIETKGLLEACRLNKVSFLAYTPLEQGLLTGTLCPNFQYPEGDFRKHDPRFTPENVNRINTALERLKPIQERHGFSTSQLMLSWTASRYDKMHVLCGMRNATRIAENAKAGTVILSENEMQLMDQLFDFNFQTSAKLAKLVSA
ncbi:MAG: aldo/keto reductase [Planctomycetaceae bacterium]|jgi:aryl-alcohol dehydrogenase-like predicted oxidoreductase|nr:aldo/keto reductase [Planctomycetaceae bacterium]